VYHYKCCCRIYHRQPIKVAVEIVNRAKEAERATRRAVERSKRATEQVPEAPTATNISILTEAHPTNPTNPTTVVIHEIEKKEMGCDNAEMNSGTAATTTTTMTLVYRGQKSGSCKW